MVSSNGNATAQKFKYNGIELEESLGLNLFFAVIFFFIYMSIKDILDKNDVPKF